MLADAAGRTRRDAERHARLIDIKAQYLRATSSGPNHPPGVGGMPAALEVVARAEAGADPRADFVAKNDAFQNLLARSADGFAKRHDARHKAGIEVVDGNGSVVEIQRMRTGAVGESGIGRGSFEAAAHYN